MLTSANDITFVLSGGTANINPNNALGGDPSSTPITDDTINNLFADVSITESDTGIEDYRCIYVFNDGETAIYNLQLWIEDFDSGSVMNIGTENRDEVQRITISGATITSGSFTLSYNSTTFVSNYNSDLAVWAAALEDSLISLLDDDDALYFKELAVIAQSVGTSVIFDIIFSGLDARRNFDQFEVIENNILPDSVSIFITTPQEGAPINTIAPEINVSTTPPGGVTFVAATESSPIILPILNPEEGFPLWTKRTVEAGVLAQERDGYTLKIRAESLSPA